MLINHTSMIAGHRLTSLEHIFYINWRVVWEINFLICGVYSLCTCLMVSWSKFCMWNVPGTFLIFRAIVSLYIYKTSDLFLARQYFCSPRKVFETLVLHIRAIESRFCGKNQQGKWDKQNQSSDHQSCFFCCFWIFKFSGCRISKSDRHLNWKQ